MRDRCGLPEADRAPRAARRGNGRHREHGRGLRGGHRHAATASNATCAPPACGTPMVFHDLTLERLIEAEGPLAAHDAAALKRLRLPRRRRAHARACRSAGARRRPRAAARSRSRASGTRRIRASCKPSRRRRPPIAGRSALMSFDPAVMAAIRELAPHVPRGIVSGLFAGDCWWRDKLGPERAYGLTHLLESRPGGSRFLCLRRQCAADPGHALRARGAGAAAVHVDGAHARSSARRPPAGPMRRSSRDTSPERGCAEVRVSREQAFGR